MALGQFNMNPTCAHLVAAKCVLQYLASTLDLPLKFNFDGGVIPMTLGGSICACAVFNADWASDKSDCRSISGYCFYFLNSLVPGQLLNSNPFPFLLPRLSITP